MANQLEVSNDWFANLTHLQMSSNQTSQQTFKILTYNVNWGACRSGTRSSIGAKVVKAILQADADICCLQETHQG